MLSFLSWSSPAIVDLRWKSLFALHLNNSPDTKPNADLDEVLNSMMERMADARWRCLNCAKTMANSTLMRRHCEIHLDCSHTCNVCGKKAKTRNALEIHTRRYHGNGVGINNIQYWWSVLLRNSLTAVCAQSIILKQNEKHFSWNAEKHFSQNAEKHFSQNAEIVIKERKFWYGMNINGLSWASIIF